MVLMRSGDKFDPSAVRSSGSSLAVGIRDSTPAVPRLIEVKYGVAGGWTNSSPGRWRLQSVSRATLTYLGWAANERTSPMTLPSNGISQMTSTSALNSTSGSNPKSRSTGAERTKRSPHKKNAGRSILSSVKV